MLGFKTAATKARETEIDNAHSAALDELDAIEASHGIDSPEYAVADARVMELADQLPSPPLPLVALAVLACVVLEAADRIRGIRYDLPAA